CGSYLLRAIAEPPRDLEVARFRRAILAELASAPARREELERIYLDIVRVRVLFCAGRQQPAQGLRRLEILRALHELFERMSGSFADATSGLTRVRDFARAVVESEGYRRLGALLDHEAHMGTVDVRMRVGSDGEVRTFQIVSVRENRENPFHASPLGRVL